jgi:hypothetical protein
MDLVGSVNPAAVLTSVGANLALGLLWFRLLFLSAWQARMGLPSTDQAVVVDRGLGLARPLVIMGGASLLAAAVLAIGVGLVHPLLRDATPIGVCLFGLGLWLALSVPQQLASVAWEHRSWQLFWIHAVYWLLAIQIIIWALVVWPST